MNSVRCVSYLRVTLVAVLSVVLLGGCVRVAGGARYWHTDPTGETTAKTAGFDTEDLIPDQSAPGKITT